MVTIDPVLFEAELYLSKGDLDRAATLFRSAHQLDEGRSELPAVGIARVALLMGKVREARSILTDVLRRMPESGPAATIWALVEENTKPIAEALPAFERAVQLAPEAWLPRYNLGRAQAQMGRMKEAIATFRKALELNPGEVPVLVALGAALAAAGHLGESIVALAEAVARAPQQLDPTLCLVDALAQAGRLDQAAELLAEAEVRFPSAPQIASKAGSIALRRGDADAARTHLRRQLSLSPQDTEAWLFLGAIALGALDIKEATVCANKAMDLEPKASRPYFLMGQVQEVIKERRLAIACYTKAAKLDPTAWQPRVNAGILLLELGQGDDIASAKRLLSEAAEKVDLSNAALVQYNQALCAARAGETVAAKSFAVKAAQGPAALEHVAQAKRLLTAL
jgi:tetratricopeptide (TPR) repeat protein